MITTTLDARFIEEVGGGGLSADDVRFAADFSRLVVRTLGLVAPTNAEREALLLGGAGAQLIEGVVATLAGGVRHQSRLLEQVRRHARPRDRAPSRE